MTFYAFHLVKVLQPGDSGLEGPQLAYLTECRSCRPADNFVKFNDCVFVLKSEVES